MNIKKLIMVAATATSACACDIDPSLRYLNDDGSPADVLSDFSGVITAVDTTNLETSGWYTGSDIKVGDSFDVQIATIGGLITASAFCSSDSFSGPGGELIIQHDRGGISRFTIPPWSVDYSDVPFDTDLRLDHGQLSLFIFSGDYGDVTITGRVDEFAPGTGVVPDGGPTLTLLGLGLLILNWVFRRIGTKP